MSEAMVQVRNVSKVYERGKQKVPVLQGLTLDIPRGDFVALMGPSGSGKTTLLNLIGGLDQPTSGEILVGGNRIDKLSAVDFSKLAVKDAITIRQGNGSRKMAVFVDPKDYEGLDLSDELSVTGLRQQMKEKMVTVHNLTKGTNFQARLELTDGEVEILLAGGKLRFYKAKLQ